MATICQCGCGEELPYGSTRKYKRGHSPSFKASGKVPTYGGVPIGSGAPRRTKAQTYNPFAGESTDKMPDEQGDAWWEINPDSSFTLNDAAARTDNDPDPWGELPERKQVFDIKITASVRRDMEGKLAFMMGMSANLWQMVDPVCGTALAQNAPNICKALVPIMCQSQDVVRWFQKASNFSLYMNLVMAVFPVLSTIYAHHLSKALVPNASVNGHAQGVVPESAYGVS